MAFGPLHCNRYRVATCSAATGFLLQYFLFALKQNRDNVVSFSDKIGCICLSTTVIKTTT